MSTHSSIPEVRGGIGLSAFSLLSGLLLALQLVLSPVALAAPAAHASGAPDPPQPQAQSEVSVVRLVAEYTAKGLPNPVLCTGLGVLVKSWPVQQTTELNSWVLTDGSLLTSPPSTCAGGNAAGKPATTTTFTLSTVNVYANNVYTGNKLENALLGTSGANPALVCAVTPSCSGGIVLFSFHTNEPQPFLDVATTNKSPQFGLELTNGASPPTWPSQSVSSFMVAQQFLDPTSVSLGAANSQSEAGMPLINSAGQLVGMRLQSATLVTSDEINAFFAQRAVFTTVPSNPLQLAWENGITAYYTQHYREAVTAFQQVKGLNPHLQAAVTFEQKAASRLSSSQGNQPGNPSQENSTVFGIPTSTALLIGLIAGLIVLVLLLVLVTLLAGRARRRRQELARFEADRAEAQRNAEIEAQQMLRSKATANLQSPLTQLSCPNCGALVQMPADFCPQCRFLLSPSASGLHLHATPPPSLAPQPQANYMQLPDVSALPISDQPTVQFSSGNGSMEAEITLPYSIQQFQGRNLSLAVGHLTDTGIKRKHKPNEDSLFAMQGARTYNALPQQFGLFVVADGMGGHANGQDASRLAIQTIINYVLPRVSSDNQVDDQAFLNLLLEGVQQANQAVHQRNLEERADMGTTMTAALIVGSVAYVANVGDSRTYLYREPEGLTKITQDHSVVASLVEAGIIKPDDIYTHPKRNQIYRSLGEKPSVDVDLFRVPLQPGDKLLLCSDGLWDMVRDPEIQRLMSAPTPDPSQTGRDLIQAALNGGGEDNVSVIVVSISEAPSDSQPGMTGIQLLAKPEDVTVPDLPPM